MSGLNLPIDITGETVPVANAAALPPTALEPIGAQRTTLNDGHLWQNTPLGWVDLSAGAGAPGIFSINGDTTSAQTIAAGTGTSVSTAAGTTTIGVVATAVATSNSIVSRDGFASSAFGAVTATTLTGNLSSTSTLDTVPIAQILSGAAAGNSATASPTSNTIAKRDGFGALIATGFSGGDLVGNAQNVTGVIAIANGGTGQSNQQAGLNNITDITSHSDGDVLQLLGGNAQFAPLTSTAPTYAQINTALALPAETFVFSDATSQVVGYTSWHLDPVTKLSNVDNFIHPNNLAVSTTAYGWNANVDPLQNSPDDSMRLQVFNVNLDSSATGFSFGSNGQAAEILGGGYNYGGNGATIGLLRHINISSGFGDGINPGTFKGISASAHSFNFSANTTIDGQVQGYDFNLNVNAAAISTSNFNILWLSDFSQIPIDLYGYQGAALQPNIATIKNNHNLNGFAVNPNIVTMEGNAGYYGFGVGGSITTLGTSGLSGYSLGTNITTVPATANVLAFTMFSQIGTLAATANVTGANLSPTITTLHGNFTGYQSTPQIAGGDGQVQLFTGGMGSVTTTGPTSVMNLNGQTATGQQSQFAADGVRMNIGGTLTAVSSAGIDSQHVIFTSFVVPNGATITGTDFLMNIFSPDVDFGDAGSSVAAGPSLGTSAMVAFAGQMHGHGQMDRLSSLLCGAIFSEDFTLGEFRDVDSVMINAGYSGSCPSATAFYHEVSGAGLFATTHWGLKVVTEGVENYVPKMAIGTSSKTVTSANARWQIENGHVKSSQTTAPTIAAQSGAGTGATAVLTNATDVAGNIELDLGTLTLGTGAQAIITFNQSYAVAPIVLLTPTDNTAASNAATFGVYTTSSTTTFTINFASAGVALSTLQWNYLVIETQ